MIRGEIKGKEEEDDTDTDALHLCRHLGNYVDVDANVERRNGSLASASTPMQM